MRGRRHTSPDALAPRAAGWARPSAPPPRRSLAFLLALTVLAAGCADGPEASRRWVEQAAADSAAADQALARGRPGQARRHLEALLSRQAPDGLAPEDERVVRQDALDRLARVALEEGRLERAERLVREGLAQGQSLDVFTANLWTTLGRIQEASGDEREAARSYHRALRLEEALLDRALSGQP